MKFAVEMAEPMDKRIAIIRADQWQTKRRGKVSRVETRRAESKPLGSRGPSRASRCGKGRHAIEEKTRKIFITCIQTEAEPVQIR